MYVGWTCAELFHQNSSEVSIVTNLQGIRKSYKAVWDLIAVELTQLFSEYGFSPKDKKGKGKFEIGNSDGQVYVYTDKEAGIHDALYLLMINPTASGKLSIKLTFQNQSKHREIAERIKISLAAPSLGKPETTKEGRFTVEYLFLTAIPPVNPVDTGKLLLETTSLWLKTITSQ